MMNCSRPTKVPVPWTGTRRDVFSGNDSSFDVDTIEFSLKMGQISLEERSSALKDIHGIADPIIETTDLIQSKTMEMTTALNCILASKETLENLAFRKALAKSPKYVDSQKVRFLRAVDYDSHEAAHRMVRFFEQKLEYFDEDKLARDITLEDLGKEETDALQSGLFQLLSERDRAGRSIVMYWGSISTEYSTEVVLRVAVYILDSILRDEESQKNGMVFVYYAKGQTHAVKGRISATVKLWHGMPVRLNSFHNCQDESGVFTSVRNIYARIAENRFLCRYRLHSGSHMECIYYLMTFGIKREAIPFSDDGTMDLTNHHRVLETLKYREKHQQVIDCNHSDASMSSLSIFSSPQMSAEMPPPESIILIPGPMDIFLGQGRRQEKRPGMLRLMNFVDEYWDEYESATKNGKNDIARNILERLRKESNCRFLNKVPVGYEECDDTIAVNRIARKFRARRAKEKRGSNENSRTPNDEGYDASFDEVFKRSLSELVE